jgi:hypothetical protein
MVKKEASPQKESILDIDEDDMEDLSSVSSCSSNDWESDIAKHNDKSRDVKSLIEIAKKSKKKPTFQKLQKASKKRLQKRNLSNQADF